MKLQQVYPTPSQMGVIDTYTIITSASWLADIYDSTIRRRIRLIHRHPLMPIVPRTVACRGLRRRLLLQIDCKCGSNHEVLRREWAYLSLQLLSADLIGRPQDPVDNKTTLLKKGVYAIMPSLCSTNLTSLIITTTMTITLSSLGEALLVKK